MAYNSSDPVQIALTVKFDNAVQKIGGAVGSAQYGVNSVLVQSNNITGA